MFNYLSKETSKRLFPTPSQSYLYKIKNWHIILFTIGNVPLLWKSKVQTETALSTMESEYIALSQGMRELVSMRTLFDEIIEILKLQTSSITRLSRVFEDNESCLKLASSLLPKMTPRSKHITVKYHWF